MAAGYGAGAAVAPPVVKRTPPPTKRPPVATKPKAPPSQGKPAPPPPGPGRGVVLPGKGGYSSRAKTRRAAISNMIATSR